MPANFVPDKVGLTQKSASGLSITFRMARLISVANIRGGFSLPIAKVVNNVI